LSSVTSIQGSTESIILSAHAKSIILSAPPTESMMIISAPPAENLILSARAESIIFSVGGPKQQSTKSCSRKCCNDGGSRGNSGSGNGFLVGSGNDDCSDDSNGNSNGDGDRGNGDSSKDDRAESIMLSAGGAESIILSAPSLKPYLLQKVVV
jgi:hypothetical protein